MDTSSELPPELASILSTLSRYAPHQATPFLPPPVQHLPGHASESFSNDRLAAGDVLDPLKQNPTPANVIDPATITEWSTGLKCVTKVAANDPRFGDAIRRMIANQRRNEVDWYSRRQELKREQSQRKSGSNELSDIMKSIGAAVSTSTPAPTEESNQAELEQYDQKVFRAQNQMNAAMEAELKAMGVPFFGTATDLIIDDTPATDMKPSSGAKWSQAITRQQLLALQRKMIAYLEDMYKE